MLTPKKTLFKKTTAGPGEIQALQSRIQSLIGKTENPSNPSSSGKLDTFLGSSCDEDSDYSDDYFDGDDVYVDTGLDGSADSYGSHGLSPVSYPTASLNEFRNAMRPTVGEENLGLMTNSFKSSLRILATNEGLGSGKYLHRSGSSFNCSTTASISGRSTSSSVSKVMKCSMMEDAKSTLGSVTARHTRGEFVSRAECGRQSPIHGKRLFGVTGNEHPRKAETCGQLEGSSHLKGNRDPHPILPKWNSAGFPAGASPDKIVEVKNEVSGRVFRLIHKATVGRPGVLCTHTGIEVIDTSLVSKPTIFSVRHSDRNVWNRQMRVHKNILLACRLTGIDVPKELEIPPDSRKMFEQNCNITNMNSYLERILPHIKINHIANGVLLYWWKPIGNGIAVLQNRTSGKLVLMKNTERTIASAVDRIVKLLNCSRLKCPTFWEPEAGYPTAETLEEELKAGGSLEIPKDELENLVTKVWGVEEGVSPTETELIVKVQTTRFLRYSVGVDPVDPKVFLIQVHYNEPLSRGLNAYLLCMTLMSSPSLLMKDLRLTFLQAVWFLKKLYDLHCESEGQQASPLHSMNSFTLSESIAARRSADLLTPSKVVDSDQSGSKETLSPLRSESSNSHYSQSKGGTDCPSRSPVKPLRLTSRNDDAKKVLRFSRTNTESCRSQSSLTSRDDQSSIPSIVKQHSRVIPSSLSQRKAGVTRESTGSRVSQPSQPSQPSTRKIGIDSKSFGSNPIVRSVTQGVREASSPRVMALASYGLNRKISSNPMMTGQISPLRSIKEESRNQTYGRAKTKSELEKHVEEPTRSQCNQEDQDMQLRRLQSYGTTRNDYSKKTSHSLFDVTTPSNSRKQSSPPPIDSRVKTLGRSTSGTRCMKPVIKERSTWSSDLQPSFAGTTLRRHENDRSQVCIKNSIQEGFED